MIFWAVGGFSSCNKQIFEWMKSLSLVSEDMILWMSAIQRIRAEGEKKGGSGKQGCRGLLRVLHVPFALPCC